jgi:polyhydroxyalkanoate synthesis regulator phasin
MEQMKMMKQMFDFQKATMNNNFNAIVMLQDQTERMVNMFLQQGTWIPEEGKKVLNEWIQACRKARDDFKKAVDESFAKVENFFAQT